AASFALTRKVKLVAGARPVTVRLVRGPPPMDAPFCNTSYWSTPTLSMDASHTSVTLVEATIVTRRLAGAGGARVSAPDCVWGVARLVAADPFPPPPLAPTVHWRLAPGPRTGPRKAVAAPPPTT